MSRSTIPGLQTCAASSETGVEKRHNAVFSSARRVWLVVQPPRTVCFTWAQFFAKFDAIICARPCSAQPTATNCPAPSRRATTPLSRPARAVGNSSHPEPPSDRFHSKLQWFLFNCLASAVECVIARLNQVSVFIHPMATFSSVLSAAKEPRLQFCCGGVVRGAPSSSAPKYEMSLPQCKDSGCSTKGRYSGLSKDCHWLVSLDTRCESQLQAGLTGLWTAAAPRTNCEYLSASRRLAGYTYTDYVLLY